MDPTKVHPSNLTAAMLRSVRRSKWADAVANNPQHSAWYVNRFRQMAAGGADLVGEARLIDAMAPRGATILDAGCGPGRHAGHLHAAGHTVVGIDLDPVLIEAAEADFPGPRYLVGDLAAARRERLVAAVTSGSELSQAQLDRLGGILQQAYGQELQLNVTVDPEILEASPGC